MDIRDGRVIVLGMSPWWTQFWGPLEVDMASMEKLVRSRANSIAAIEAEVSEMRLRLNGIPASDADARIALLDVVTVKEQRLSKLRRELEAFKRLAAAPVPDPRQLEVPVNSKKR